MAVPMVAHAGFWVVVPCPSPPAINSAQTCQRESKPAPSTIFAKTKKCRFFGMGICTKGDACTYAHGRENLRPAPDFSCTKLCPAFMRGAVCRDSACKFAHAKDEKRKFVNNGVERIQPPLLKAGQAEGQSDLHKRLCPRGRRAGRRATTSRVDEAKEDLLVKLCTASKSHTLCTKPGARDASPRFGRVTTLSTEAGDSDYQDASDDEDSFACTFGGSCPERSDSSKLTSRCPSPRPEDLDHEEVEDAILLVQNTFLTFEVAQPPLEQRLRRVSSAPGFLEHIIESMQHSEELSHNRRNSRAKSTWIRRS